VASLVFCVAAVAGVAWGAAAPAQPAGAPLDAVAAADAVFAATNEDRADAGLEPLVRDASLDSFAGEWSEQLADAGELAHRVGLGAATAEAFGPSGWTVTGENVGRGSSPEAVTDAFLASPDHRVNLLDPDFDRVGVAVTVTADGELFVAVNFVG
jgi:uncharacterized protein YkwD